MRRHDLIHIHGSYVEGFLILYGDIGHVHGVNGYAMMYRVNSYISCILDMDGEII